MNVNSDFTKRYEKVPVDIFEDSSVASTLVAESIAETIKKKERKKPTMCSRSQCQLIFHSGI